MNVFSAEIADAQDPRPDPLVFSLNENYILWQRISVDN
jgi:hypothetical protein